MISSHIKKICFKKVVRYPIIKIMNTFHLIDQNSFSLKRITKNINIDQKEI